MTTTTNFPGIPPVPKDLGTQLTTLLNALAESIRIFIKLYRKGKLGGSKKGDKGDKGDPGQDATLTAKLLAIDGAAWAANKILYMTGENTVDVCSLTAWDITFLGSANGAEGRAALGLGTAATTASTAYATAEQGATADDALQRSGGTMSGDIDCNGNKIDKVKLVDVRETAVSLIISSGAVTLDLSIGRYFYATLTANITSISLSNVPAPGNAVYVVIEFKQDATGGRSVAGWPSSFKWSSSGTAYSATTVANAKDKVVASTRDGGTSWDASISQKDIK